MARKSRDISQSEHNETRMRRAWSWLRLSEKSKSHDEKFIFLWIAFNAAYGTELSDESIDENESPNKRTSRRPSKEIERFTDFVSMIVERDREGAIETILQKKFSGPVEGLLKNKYVFGSFWKWVKERPDGENWESEFEKRNERVFKARRNGKISYVLEEVLKRLYVLRNQIVHGGTTFAEGLGRSQVKDGYRIMEALMPPILNIMEEDIRKTPDSSVWGILDYPRVGDDDQPDRTPTT